jgi:diguanylate cyclase (GGDEF)-like protein
LRSLRGSNRALLSAADESALLHEVCRVVVDEAGYRAALVVRADDQDAHAYTLLAQVGLGDEAAPGGHWHDAPQGDSASGRALRSGKPCVVNRLDGSGGFGPEWQGRAAQLGIGAVLALPLQVDGTLFGALTIAAPEPDAFDELELQLLQEMALDLALGLGVLRMRSRADNAEASLRQMAWFDGVTGLPNRARLRVLLTEAIAAATQPVRPLALLRIEIERFRELNETLGDAELDRLMRDLSARLAAVVGTRAQAARLSESEFAVLLPHSGADAANDTARRLLDELAEPVEAGRLLLDARSCIGIALFPGHGRDADVLMRRASVALDQAKRNGRRVATFEEGQDLVRQQRLRLLGELRRAIERDELQLYCQPQLDLASNRIVGAEALVRWPHPTLGLVNPSEFIGLAESGGIITPLTYWVLDAALRARHQWQQQGLVQPLGVNLSAHDLREPRLLEHIDGALDTWGVGPEGIEFELTETALMDDPPAAREVLQQLKRRGHKLALDDFGTGYSSLAYLQRLPVDALKIDRSFVAAMARDAGSAAIVRSTIELAHNLGLKVVAEGVEDPATLQRLRDWGCDRAQGYAIGRPVPAAAAALAARGAA